MGPLKKKNGPQHFLIYIFRTHHGTKIELRILHLKFWMLCIQITECTSMSVKG